MLKKLLSICMIVKNEENCLTRCLESVKDMADEIIIVDTGSTDRTKEIALSYTDKVYSYTWNNNFADARNESLKYATSRWILILDADEYIAPEQIATFKNFLCDLHDPVCGIVKIINLHGDSNTFNQESMIISTANRIIRNNFDITYTGALHEQLTAASTYKLIEFPLTLFHTGYLKSIVEGKGKNKRNLDILQQMNPEQLTSHPYYAFVTGNEYMNQKDYEKACFYYDLSHSRTNQTDNWASFLFENYISSLLQLNNYSRAYALTKTAQTYWESYSDFYYIEGVFLEFFGLRQQAKKIFKECLSKPFLIRSSASSIDPYRKLTNISIFQEDYINAVTYLTQWLTTNPDHTEARQNLIHLLVKSDTTESIISFIDKLYDKKNPRDTYLLFRSFLASAHPELASFYNKLCHINNVPLTIEDELAIALLTKQNFIPKDLNLSTELKTLPDSLLLTAAICYKNQFFLTAASSESLLHLYSQLQRVLDHTTWDTSCIINHQQLLIDVLVLLHIYKYDDLFSNLLEQIADEVILNQVAHTLYNLSDYHLALEYYSILLDNGFIDEEGLIKMGLFFLKQLDFDSACQLFTSALSISPRKDLIGFVYDYEWPNHLRDSFSEKYYEKFPDIRNLPIFNK